MRMRAALACLAGVAVACGSTPESGGFKPVRAATIEAPFPEPTGEVVLDVVAGDGVEAFDLALLESLETVDATIVEPFVEEEHTFTGVPMLALLEAGGVDGAETVTLTALDDYLVSFTTEDLDDAMLATRQDGAPISIEDGGPIRIIFIGESATARNTDNWIWSIRTVAVG